MDISVPGSDVTECTRISGPTIHGQDEVGQDRDAVLVTRREEATGYRLRIPHGCPAKSGSAIALTHCPSRTNISSGVTFLISCI